jgi:chromosome segregation ATPase
MVIENTVTPMVNRVVTDDDIIAVCEAMRAEGHTALKRQTVYERLGRRGGMTTINRVVAEWERRQGEPAPPPPLRLLPEDQQAILEFGARMLEVLTVRLRAEMDALRARTDKQIALERAQAADMADAAETLQNEIEAERATLAQERTDTQTRLERLQVELTAATYRADTAEAELATVSREIDELRTRLSAATAALDAAERRQAHAEGRAQALERQIGDLRELLENERRSHQAALAERDAAHQRSLVELRDTHRRAVDNLEQRLEEERAVRRRTETDLAGFTAQLRTLDREAAEARTRDAESRLRADTLQRQFDTLMTRLNPIEPAGPTEAAGPIEQLGPPLPPDQS